MTITEREIIELVSSRSYNPCKLTTLARNFKVKKREFSAFHRLIREMIDSGKLTRSSRGRIGPPAARGLLSGRLSITRSGRSFFAPDDGSDEILIPEHARSVALNGDTVTVRLTGRLWRDKQIGEVAAIVKRNKEIFVGVYQRSRIGGHVVPENARAIEEIKVQPPKDGTLKSGMKVVVALKPWDNPALTPEGKIIHILGYPNEPGVDTLSVIHGMGLPEKFPDNVLVEAEQIKAAVEDSMLRHRLDLRRELVFTIDPEDAKDYDDAVSLEKTKSGYRLGVHIADVSHYVTEESKLNREAKVRSFSAYLADRVIPMLPERLSNDICSLKEKEDRLTMSALIELDREGNVVECSLTESIIRSRARLSYEKVQRFLDSGVGFEKMKRVGQQLLLMKELAEILIRKRLSEGSLDFDLPEYKVQYDQDGRVSDIKRHERQLSHRLVEEFMLLANKVVAREFISKNIPTLYRVHPPPEEKKLSEFSEFAAGLSEKVSFGSPPQAKLISKFLMSLHGHDNEEILTGQLIRAMQKALYQPKNIGHFGLGFQTYLHFTSPIRRYPDLLVHRTLKKMLRGQLRSPEISKLKGSLNRIGKRCSEREVLIMQAEYATLKIKQAEYLSHQLGEVYRGMISGMLKFGFFVRLADIGAEGMVRLSELNDDYYRADLDKKVVVGARSGKRYRLGDKVMVQVVNVARESGEIDLRLVGDKRKPKGVRGRRTSRRK